MRFETVVEETPAIFAMVVIFTIGDGILFTLHVKRSLRLRFYHGKDVCQEAALLFIGKAVDGTACASQGRLRMRKRIARIRDRN
jgi:hypothetical protein